VLEASGFDDVAEQHEQVPWSFADADEMLAFCRELFGLAHVPAKVLGQAIHDLLPVASDAAGTRIDWCLRYAAAGKP